MKAENVLGITAHDSFDKIAARYEEWLQSYKKIAIDDSTAEEYISRLTERIERAFGIMKSRNDLKKDTACCRDEAFMDEYIRGEEEQERLLDGDFPLGNEFDAEFAATYFTVPELVLIQLGRAQEIHTGNFSEYNTEVLISKGFICEMLGKWKEAEQCYSGVSTSKSVQQRELYCRERAERESEELYNKGMKMIEELCWNEAWYPLSLAADSGHTEAMAEIGYMTVYGIGCGRDIDEGLEYLRKAASSGSDYACSVLWELHDDGIFEVSGAEAEKWCKLAASRGDKKASVRLESGFDLRPLKEILAQQIEKGNKDAIWLMMKECEKQGDGEEVVYWFDKALEARQRDALVLAAQIYSDEYSELYDKNKSEEYYRQAAEEGSITAMLKLGDDQLKTAEKPFYENQPYSDIPPEVTAEHINQLQWYEKAAASGDDTAAYYVSRAYAKGYPLRDCEKAFLFASKGADNGDSLCMYMCGCLFEDGIGCEKDMDSAMMFYIQAAEKGVHGAIMRLIDIYTNGKDGVPADKQKANRYKFMCGAGRD